MSRTHSRHAVLIAAVVAVVMIGYSNGVRAAQAAQGKQAAITPNSDAAVIADFQARVNQYVALHQKLEATLPKLAKETSPQLIDKNQRALAALIQKGRPKAQRGDLFTPQMTVIIKRLMDSVFGGPDGKKLRSSVMDENVKELPLTVNQRFPSAIPMATMPPAILKALPVLPEEMQYRFVATQFALLDPHANIVADFIPGVISIK